MHCSRIRANVWRAPLAVVCRSALAAALSLALPALRPAYAAERQLLAFGGYDRQYQVALPSTGEIDRPVPLVLVLHGAGGSGALALRRYRWDQAAREHDFIAAAPDALPAFPDRPANFLNNPRYWNDGSGRGRPEHLEIDDIGFISALLDRLTEALPIDRNRIYVTGFSSGAGMTYRLGLDLADRLAAIAPVSGQGFGRREPARPLPVLYLVGDQDPLTPLAGGMVRLPWGGGVQDHPPARRLPETWAILDHCRDKPGVETPAPTLKLEHWRHCAGKAEVLFYTVAGLGHEWPGGNGRVLPTAITGPYTDAVNATELIWAFFQRQRLE